MPWIACRDVVVGAVCATVHATDDYLNGGPPATAPGPLPPPRVTCPGAGLSWDRADVKSGVLDPLDTCSADVAFSVFLGHGAR